MAVRVGIGFADFAQIGLQVLDRWALRCPTCPATPSCSCPPVSVALTCAGPSSTGAITTEGFGLGPGLGFALAVAGVVVGFLVGRSGWSVRWPEWPRSLAAVEAERVTPTLSAGSGQRV